MVTILKTKMRYVHHMDEELLAIHSMIITVIYLAVGFAVQNFRREGSGCGETHNFYYPVKPIKPNITLVKPGFSQ